MKTLIQKQLLKLDKRESKMLNKKPNQFIENNITVFLDKLEEKIPEGLRDTLDNAFEKAFKLVFEKGTVIIEKTYSKDKLSFEHEINDFAIKNDRNILSSRKYLKNIDRISNKSKFMGKGVSFIEGAGLGLLGIGIPDIPLFISVLLKGIYEVSTGYGFEYNSKEEKIYILKLIQAALSEGDDRLEKNEEVNLWVLKMKTGNMDADLEIEIKETAKILSNQMLLAKFIQGLPLIGIAGSIFNVNVYTKISDYTTIKYKKRYLNNKI